MNRFAYTALGRSSNQQRRRIISLGALRQYLFLKQILGLLEQTKGQFFSVTYKKKDGSERTLVTRTGVTKGLAVNPAARDIQAYETYQKNNPHLYRAFDLHKKGWRTVNLSTLSCLRARGKEWKFK